MLRKEGVLRVHALAPQESKSVVGGGNLRVGIGPKLGREGRCAVKQSKAEQKITVGPRFGGLKRVIGRDNSRSVEQAFGPK